MNGRQVSSTIYTKEYYRRHSLGFEELKKYRGRDILDRLLKLIKLKKESKILDVGCGQGDLAIYLAQQGAYVTGIDYSRDAIILANQNLAMQRKEVRNRTIFILEDASKINFPKNYFDIVLAVDIFEHLYPEELEKVLKKVSGILRKDGEFLIHTEANKIYLNFIHKWFVYPMSSFLIKINKMLTSKNYPNLPRDARNDLHKIQHVNEPTYYYLKDLFKAHNFVGKIIPRVPYKPNISWKDLVYNFVVWLFPISSIWPFHIFFAYDYICVMKNKKR